MGLSAASLALVAVSAYLVSGLTENDTQDTWTAMEDCLRECDGVPKICYQKLHIERYTVLTGACRECEIGVLSDCYLPACITADGFQRPIVSVNRKYPAPAIEVCKGDKVVVDVINQMPDETTTVHWHGLKQNGTQWYDGVPYVTQCPIGPGLTFRYIFDASDPGTYFYHSHTGAQKLDGVAGALIIRDEKANELHASLYDEDLSSHVIFITDWTHVPGEHLIPGFHSKYISQSTKTFLINGKGSHYDKSFTTPIEEFVVEKGKRYRFRIIGSTCLTCGVGVKFEGHKVTAISADGGLNFEPTEVDSLIQNPADRFDVILHADKPEGIYYITLQGIGPGCDEFVQHAILKYKGSTLERTDEPVFDSDFGIAFNDITSKCDGSLQNEICMNNVNGTTNAPLATDGVSYQSLVLDLNFEFLNENDVFKNNTYTAYDEPVKGLYTKPYINKMAFTFPPSPLLSQYEDIPQNSFCSEECKNGTVSPYCSCTNVYELILNAVVDIIFLDGDHLFSHPMHVHGHNFWVMEMGVFKNKTEELKDLKRRLLNDEIDTHSRTMRDTISVPHGGYAAIRFISNNPGFWIVHCHFAFHLEGGMSVVLKVGDKSDLPPKPKHFPECGNFLPTV